jgi:hypothetical protein
MPDSDEPVATITSQIESYEVGDTAQPVKGTYVYFRTVSGDKGSVFIPADQYNRDTVRAAVRAKALEMHAVKNQAV